MTSAAGRERSLDGMIGGLFTLMTGGYELVLCFMAIFVIKETCLTDFHCQLNRKNMQNTLMKKVL